jgi:polysaccharide pyruvyl transferase WcaK-like protein
VVAVAYARKVRQLMQDVHLAQYSVDFDAVSASGLVALVERSLAEEASLRGHILKQTEAYRAALGVAYDEMLGEN